jgi:hypothetical protein
MRSMTVSKAIIKKAPLAGTSLTMMVLRFSTGATHLFACADCQVYPYAERMWMRPARSSYAFPP